MKSLRFRDDATDCAFGREMVSDMSLRGPWNSPNTPSKANACPFSVFESLSLIPRGAKKAMEASSDWPSTSVGISDPKSPK